MQPSAVDQIIPAKNPKALFAYYCAIFGLIPCDSPILGPVAFGLGLAGRSAIKRDPSLPGTAHAWIGIVLGGIELLLSLAVIGLAAFG